jgi:predicted RNA-binding protein YlxR (DUF448 family)
MSQQKGRIQTRTCVVCRERRQRTELLRVVRTPEGQVVFDRTGRMNGRGAYVCADADHRGDNRRSGSIDRGRLRNALKTQIDDSMVNLLTEAIELQTNERLKQ